MSQLQKHHKADMLGQAMNMIWTHALGVLTIPGATAIFWTSPLTRHSGAPKTHAFDQQVSANQASSAYCMLS